MDPSVFGKNPVLEIIYFSWSYSLSVLKEIRRPAIFKAIKEGLEILSMCRVNLENHSKILYSTAIKSLPLTVICK